MNKIFLSHSSKDKPYVSYIAECFGKDNCVYDQMCFEAGMKNLDEIFRGIDHTGIFVVFLSNNSLDSDWVQKELSIADERLNHDVRKLSQILPIIIDPSITHNDSRIPSFIKNGFGSYNLRVIASNVVAYRKIKAQQVKYLMENHLLQPDMMECFYGRDEEIASFKKAFDAGDGIKCVVANGFPGIGRKAYLLQCLRNTKIIEEYYTPPTISLNGLESIEDLIIKLSEIGFGDNTLETVATLVGIDSKIDILKNVFQDIQNYQEQVIIYDDNCLINRRGEIVYWFTRALQAIRPEVTFVIASSNAIGMYALRANPSVFSQPLTSLPYTEWMGLMRVYGKKLGVELSLEDRSYFKDILTGYPPQVRYCVERIKDTSITEVKDSSYRIIERFSPKVTEMLESAIPKELHEDGYGLLSFISSYGIVPTDLLVAVLKAKDSYRDLFSLFKTLTICRYLGISNEYVEVNPVISDYIQRGRFDLPDDIREILSERLSAFNALIEVADRTKAEDFENLKYYLKANIIAGKSIPERFMYSTLYLSSIYDLYNHQKYTQVINLVQKLKDTNAFSRYDVPVQIRIQGYYCRSLARETNAKFYEEVEFFHHGDDKDDDNEYNFLRGFMFRHNSEYGKALERYRRVLDKQPRHRSAMREIVIVYRGLEDYESAYEYAKTNYLRDPENLYQIQPFFEILVRKPETERTDTENQYIDEMLKTTDRISAAKPNTTYYEILGQYAAYIEKDKNRSIALLTEGVKKFPDSSYVVKSLFDCSELFGDMTNMSLAITHMETLTSDNKATKIAYDIRMALYNAHQRKPADFVYHCISSIAGIDDEAKARITKRVQTIMK
ncbi:MAG: toll/interleukin-1 receptor domain-containing protein [Oscillospiraceae bacterium]|nr:toll/interleukin-1 receptor domain-containing protein [Oscillospiraceae bacterium]